MDALLGQVASKIEQIRVIQTANQQELAALNAKVGHLHNTSIVNGKLTIAGPPPSDVTQGEVQRWNDLCSENEALNQVVKQHEVALAIIMDRLRLQKLVNSTEVREMRANVEEVLLLQEEEISALRLENARLKERLAKAEEVILAALVSEEDAAVEPE